MKKEKNNVALSAKEKRQLEIVSKYYDVDVDQKIIYIKMHFDKASDALNSDIITKKPIIKPDVLQSITDTIDLFPESFKCDLQVVIDDYEGFDPNLLLNSFKDIIELHHYYSNGERNKTRLIAFIFLIISLSLLSLRYIIEAAGWLSSASMVYEIMDISAWVFLWEFITLLFISPTETRSYSQKLGHLIVSASFYDQDGNVLCSNKNDELLQNWIQENKAEHLARLFILIGASLVLASGVSDVVNAGVEFYNAATYAFQHVEGYAFAFVTASITVIEAVIFIIGGIAGLSVYREHGPLKKTFPIFAYVFMIFDIFALGFIIAMSIIFKLGGNVAIQLIIGSIMSLLSSIFYFVGYFMNRRYQRINKVNQEKKEILN